MDSFDKNINKAFNSGHNDAVPSGYEWADMEQDIMDKMPEEKPLRKPFVFWVLGLTAMVLVFGALIYTNQRVTKQNKTASLPINNPFQKEEIDKTADQNIIPIKSQEEKVSLEEKNIPPIVKKPSSNNLANEPDIKAHSKYVKSKDKNLIQLLPNMNDGVEKVEGGVINVETQLTIDKPKYILNNTINLGSEINKTSQNRLFMGVVTPLPTYLTIVKYYPNKPIFKSPKIKIVEDEIKAIEPKKVPTKWPIAIKVASGINVWSAQHNNATYMDEYTTHLPGYFVDLSLGYEIEPKWQIEIGYNHQKLISLFDFEKNDFDDYTYQNAILNINTNSLTGQIIQTVGDTTVSAPRYRDVHYYNVLKTHTVKLSLGRRVHLAKKLNIDLSSGLSYLFGLDADGYNIDSQEELVHYTSSDNIYKSKQLALGLKVNVAYKLSSKLELSLGFSTDKYLSNWSANKTFDYRPFIVNFNGGIQYKF